LPNWEQGLSLSPCSLPPNKIPEKETMLESDDILLDTLNLSPELRLWLACLKNAVETLKETRFGDSPAKRAAKEFIFEDHPGFDWLCDVLGYDPEAMRRRVRKAATERKSQ
jgi:hypothetical protein